MSRLMETIIKLKNITGMTLQITDDIITVKKVVENEIGKKSK